MLDAPKGELSLSGPSFKAEEGHLPVRGDLAHIKLAGRFFVPHYAVPMPHVVKDGGATLLKTADQDADIVEQLDAGSTFDVLDITASWAWGQVATDNPDEEGSVGYVRLEALDAQRP